MKGFYEHVAHRAVCDDCGELHLVAVVKRGRFPDVRVCEKCFRLRNWVKPEWRDARWQRHRANRLQKELAQALAERDRARDLGAAMVCQPTLDAGIGEVGLIQSGPAALPEWMVPS